MITEANFYEIYGGTNSDGRIMVEIDVNRGSTVVATLDPNAQPINLRGPCIVFQHIYGVDSVEPIYYAFTHDVKLWVYNPPPSVTGYTRFTFTRFNNKITQTVINPNTYNGTQTAYTGQGIGNQIPEQNIVITNPPTENDFPGFYLVVGPVTEAPTTPLQSGYVKFTVPA